MKKFAQELLSTFNTDLGEVSLIPRTGGIFTVTIFPRTNPSDGAGVGTRSGDGNDGDGGAKILWDRKTDGGFPGTSHPVLSISTQLNFSFFFSCCCSCYCYCMIGILR